MNSAWRADDKLFMFSEATAKLHPFNYAEGLIVFICSYGLSFISHP